jgi:glycine cleavage system transcriptional repressor
MTTQWFMLAVVGRDRAGIVARLTQALFEAGANLGEASMLRLGGNFAMMLMVGFAGDVRALEKVVSPHARDLGLTLHVDPIEGQLHRHIEPNVSVSVYGADRAGIVARVTGALAGAGLHILNLESDVGGSEQQPIYIMHIEGHCAAGADAMRQALADVQRDGIQVHVESIEPMVG